MNAVDQGRRRFLAFYALAPVALAASRAAAADQPGCYDPAALSLSQKSRRRSLGYAESSPDPVKHCGICTFFASSTAGCGNCQILGGGPVNAGGLCSSFAPKPK